MHLIRIGATLALFTWAFDGKTDDSIQSPAISHRLDQWLVWRGVTTKVADADSASGCVEVKVGTEGEVGLACQVTTHVERGAGNERVYRVAIRERVYVVRLGRVSTVFDAVVVLTPLDAIDDIAHPLLVLGTKHSPRGDFVWLTNGDPEATGCTTALASLSAQAREASDAASRRWIAFDRELVTRACRESGPYAWSGARFSRSPSKTP